MLPLDWQVFKHQFQEKLISMGFEKKAKGLVSDVVYNADFSICGPGGILFEMGTTGTGGKQWSDKTPRAMYESAARTRLKKHYKALAKDHGVKFLQIGVGRASSSSEDELQPLGDLVVMLFDRECPKTTARFLSLVEQNVYNDCAFKYITDSYIQCDYVPVSSETVPDECFDQKHSQIGCIGFARRLGEVHSNGNTNQFYISLGAIPEFDSGVSRKQCFARVVDGMRFLKMVAKTERNGSAPLVKCGIMNAKVVEF